jgi:hypothetical protein
MARARARIASLTGRDDEADVAFAEAAERFRALGYPFWTAVCLTDRAAWLAGRGRVPEARELAEEARRTFESLGARPWVTRASAIAAGHPAGTTGSSN